MTEEERIEQLEDEVALLVKVVSQLQEVVLNLIRTSDEPQRELMH